MRTKEFMKAWVQIEFIFFKSKQQNAMQAHFWAEQDQEPVPQKFSLISRRIARLLESSHDNNFRILGLTFTDKAADEMRSRVVSFAPG